MVRSALVEDETRAGRLVVGERKRRIQQKRTKSPAAGKKNSEQQRCTPAVASILFVVFNQRAQNSNLANSRSYPSEERPQVLGFLHARDLARGGGFSYNYFPTS